MPFRALSPLSPRSLNFRLVAGFFAILLLIFSLGNLITIYLAKERLYQQRDAQIAARREAFRAESEQAEQRLIHDLQAQLQIIAKAVQGPLQNQISHIHDASAHAEEQIVQQFSDCLKEAATQRIYQCLKMSTHHFFIDSIELTNRLMIKASIELLLSREELVAVEVLDWDDRLFDGYALDQEGIPNSLQQRFASSGRQLRSMEQPVIGDDYLGRIVFYYDISTIEALRRKADASIARLIEETNRSVRESTRQITRMRVIEGAFLFILSLLGISTITLMKIIHPLRQLTRYAEDIANGNWSFMPASDASAHRKDELGILIRTFNLMSDRIRRSHQELQAANTQLEGKVEERTRELEEKNRELEALSTTDWLTKVSNRIKLEADLLGRIQWSQRHGAPFSILLCDVDFFKRINDTYGHQVGDLVLVEMADLLKRIMRQTDHVGRWGGEEFLLILPQTNLEDAMRLAERLRVKVAGHAFPGGQTTVTISGGLSSYRVGDTQDAMIERADKALYRAKAEGRNRVAA